MPCPACRLEVPEGAKFCSHCGAAQRRRCNTCGNELADAHETCPHRATPLAARDAASSRPFGGERRHVTVLFSDLTGSTELSTRLDPEDYRDVVAAYRRTATADITRFGGQVIQYVGDGVLALFGYPQAHENDAARAVRAGLTILADVREIATGETNDTRLAARVGVHTGETVITGEVTTDIYGQAPNVAARVQAVAAVGSLCITAETLRLLGDTFAVESLGTHALKGIREPQALYRVTSAAETERSADGVMRERAALVGRERERGELLAGWRSARDGHGGTVVLIGEAGIGKTRLLQALRDDLAGEAHQWLAAESSPYHQQTDFYPIRTLRTADEALIAALAAALAPGSAPATADRQRERILSSVRETIAQHARALPTVLVLEDLHWADASTLELVRGLAADAAELPLLVILTTRPDLERPLPAGVEVQLRPLAAGETRTAVLGRAGGALSEASVARIVARSDGVPFFAEELVDFFLAAGETAPGDAAIPATLQGLLMNRIDRLGAAKAVAQIGAVLGRSFRTDLLRAVARMPSDALDAALDELQRAGILEAAGAPAQASFAFRHALVRDAAYALLLRRARRALHRDTANVLVGELSEEGERQPELVAHHFELAEEHAAAAHHWQRAAGAVVARGAYVEAIDQLRHGLACLAREGAAGGEEELVMHLLLGEALHATRGQGDDEAGREFALARSLISELAESPHLTRVLTAAYEIAVSQGAMHTAREVVTQMRALGAERNDPTLLTCAHAASGTTAFAAGDLFAADEAFQQVALHHQPQLRQRDFMTGFTARSYRPLLSWLRGRADESERECTEERRRAADTDHPFVVAIVDNGIGLAHAYRGDASTTRQAGEALRALAAANGYGLFEESAHCLLAIARMLEGEGRGAVADLEAVVDRIRDSGNSSWTTAFVPFLVQGLCDAAAPQRALALVERAMREDEDRGHALCRAEFERVRALSLELLGAPREEVVAAYETALGTARRQGARAFELRAEASLKSFREKA